MTLPCASINQVTGTPIPITARVRPSGWRSLPPAHGKHGRVWLRDRIQGEGLCPSLDARGIRRRLTLHEELTWDRAERLTAFIGHPKRFADLDPPWFLAENPFDGGYRPEGGILSVAHIAAGHGVTPRRTGV